MIVPYAPGGFADTRVRLLARKLGESLGQPIVVENKAGAGGVVGTNLIAKAAPDGYTIGTGNLAPMAVNPSLMKDMPYNPQKDLAPVILIENSPLVLSVNNELPVKTLADLIAMAKKQPGKLSFGSSGVGGAHHLSGEMFREQAKIDIVHVPYKGGSLAATDLMGGHISMMFEMGYSALPAIQGQKIHPIAVTSAQRLAVLPDVPTMAESGLPGFESYNWQGIVAPPAPRAHHRQAQCRVQPHPEGTRRAEGHCRHRQPGRRRHARGIRRVHQERNGQVGASHQGWKHPAPVSQPGVFP